MGDERNEREAESTRESSSVLPRSARESLKPNAKKGFDRLHEDAVAVKMIQCWSDERLAEAAGVGKGVIERFIHHKNRPWDTNLYKICDVLGIRVGDYIDDRRQGTASESELLNTRFGKRMNARYHGAFAITEDLFALLERVLPYYREYAEENFRNVVDKTLQPESIKEQLIGLKGEYKATKTFLCGKEKGHLPIPKNTRKEME